MAATGDCCKDLACYVLHECLAGNRPRDAASCVSTVRPAAARPALCHLPLLSRRSSRSAGHLQATRTRGIVRYALVKRLGDLLSIGGTFKILLIRGAADE